MNKVSEDILTEKQRELLDLLQDGMITQNDTSDRVIKMMRQTDILKNHMLYCSFWQASDGRWKTKVPDQNAPSGNRLLARKRKEDLEQSVIEWYAQNKGSLAKPSLRTIYKSWITSKEKETSMANASKLAYVWSRYYESDPIAEIPLADMSTGYLKDWLLDTVAKHHLSKKKFKEVKSVLNMMFDYAISYNYASVNLPRQIRGFSERIFEEAEEKPVEEIIYVEETRSEVIDEALAQFEKTGNTAYLAVCLNFTLGLRVGELVVLRRSSINDDGTISITREEVKTYIKDQNGKYHRNGYEVVNHTKTASGKRQLVLTKSARHYIDMALRQNALNGFPDSDDIFIDKQGHRIHDYAVNNVLRRLNGVRNERDAFVISGKPSGNHAIRKTCISELHESLMLSDETIRDFAGHKDISTTRSCYVFRTKPITAYADRFEKVFDR